MTPLVLKGNLAIGIDAGSAVDVSDSITALKITANRDIVDVPATLAGPKSFRAGGAQYAVEISYLSTDEDPDDTVFAMFWTAIASADGILYFEGSMRDGTVSDANPLWSGEFIVTGAAIGGDAEALSTDSQTFPCVAKPGRAAST